MKKLRAKDGYSEDEDIPMYDLSYYRNLVEESCYQVDQNELQEYFPLEHVLEQMLNLYQHLLGLKFVKLEVDESEDPLGRGKLYWHKDVSYYKVLDTQNDNELIGHFYLDLFPREGKFSHAAQYLHIANTISLT